MQRFIAWFNATAPGGTVTRHQVSSAMTEPADVARAFNEWTRGSFLERAENRRVGGE